MNEYIEILPIHVLYSLTLSFLTKVEILVLSTKHILFGHVPYISTIKVDNNKSFFILDGVWKEKIFLKLFFSIYGNGRKVAWSVDYESTHVDTISLIMWKWHIKCRCNILNDCHKKIESGNDVLQILKWWIEKLGLWRALNPS